MILQSNKLESKKSTGSDCLKAVNILCTFMKIYLIPIKMQADYQTQKKSNLQLI